LREKGFSYLSYRIASKICKKFTSKEFPIEAKPFEDFYYIQTTPTNNPEIETLRVKDNKDFTLEVPFKFNTAESEIKIAAIIHIFYPELSKNIEAYINNITQTTDIYISTDTQEKKESILKHFSTYSNGSVEVRVFENRGRDIAPFLIGFRDVFEKYTYFVHLHSKKSPHGGKGLLDWREYLYETLLGSSKVINSIIYMLEHKNVGIVFPQHFIPLRININWGYDFTMAKNLLKKMGINIHQHQLLEFPSGSMFWGRCDVMSPLLNQHLSFSDFEPEMGQTDGTLAHAIERSFLYICEAQHYRWAKIARTSLYPLKKTILSSDDEKQLDAALQIVYRPLFNTYIQKDDKLLSNVAEYIKYNTYPSACKKSRLNLLLPTINAKEIFGGIATALKIFNSLKLELKESFDYRIIIDIGLIDEASKESFQTYEFFTKVEDDFISMQLVETVTCKELYLRENDFFIATAWWTASSAFKLLEDQTRFFNTTHKLIYLIQDYESDFYACSAKWVFAENTYKQKEKTVAIFNSEELALFMQKRFNFSDAYYLPYTINDNIKKALKETKRKKQILIYARPTVDRNTFELIIDALSLWQKRNPLTCKEWHIYSLGERYDNTLASNVKNITVVGKASLEEYANYLSESMIGISLMISPHPSYPPLEMAYAGMKVISNSYDNKDLSKRSENIISLDILDVETVVNTLENLCEDALIETFSSKRGLLSNIEIEMPIYTSRALIKRL